MPGFRTSSACKPCWAKLQTFRQRVNSCRPTRQRISSTVGSRSGSAKRLTPSGSFGKKPSRIEWSVCGKRDAYRRSHPGALPLASFVRKSFHNSTNVGQIVNLRPIVNRPVALNASRDGPITNRPQVNNLPHSQLFVLHLPVVLDL